MLFRSSTKADSKVNMSVGVKGSQDDKTGVYWWATKRTFSSANVDLPVNKWTPVEAELDISWDGLVEMAFLNIQGTARSGLNMFIDDVSVVKISEIRGERRECYLPEEGTYTIDNIRIS